MQHDEVGMALHQSFLSLYAIKDLKKFSVYKLSSS